VKIAPLSSLARVGGNDAATLHDERLLNRAILQQYEQAADMEESEMRRERKLRIGRDKSDVQKRLRALQDELDETVSVRSIQRLERLLELETVKLKEVEREERALLELEHLEADQTAQSEERERLVAAGHATPFSDVVTEKPEEGVRFQTNNRKGTWKDDSDDRVYAARLQAWTTGADLGEGEEEEEEEEENDDLLEQEAELFDDEAEGAVPDFQIDTEPIDLEVDFDFDKELRVYQACGECLKTPGLTQLLQILDKRYEETVELYCLPALLKDCRFKVQRALDLILTKSEAEVRALYPPLQCAHAEPSVVRPSKKKKEEPPALPKSSAPVALPLPQELQALGPKAVKEADVVFDERFRLPMETYNCLFEYQRTGVRWLWELHKQQVGGILADEMGLGKSVQMVVFLYGALHSGLLQLPVLLICPATVMKQWVSEFHKWGPAFRVIMMHGSSESQSSKDSMVLKAVSARGKGVLITTFEAFRRSTELLLPHQWSYAVLDEGHKIRNPDADITLACKKINTHRRIILTGTPIQNSLKELWSLMDFVFPGKLGTLPVFQREFEVPIQMGGYASASPSQVITSLLHFF
jgi:hypothetical protein